MNATPAWPDFDIYQLGARQMRNGQTAVIWKATTTINGQPYTLTGPLRSNPLLTTSPYINDIDGAQEALERRLSRSLPT